jgi:PST family polysaccharide transporter
MILFGLLLGVALYVFAPLLVHIAGSASFSPAVTVLRIFSPLPLLLAISHSVGVQWLFSLGREAVVTRIIITAGILNLILAVFLAPRFAHFGMAWSVVAAEMFVCISMVVNVRRISPFWKSSANTSLNQPMSDQPMNRDWIAGSDPQPATTLTHSH